MRCMQLESARCLPAGPAPRQPTCALVSRAPASSNVSFDDRGAWTTRCTRQLGRRRRQVLRPDCAAQPRSSAVTPHHFLRPSLLATGLTEPSDIVQHCLALFRKADLASLRQYLPDSYAAALPLPAAPAGAESTAAAAAAAAGSSDSGSAGHVHLGGGGGSTIGALGGPVWMRAAEAGPLAPLAGVLDVAARRVLPGHLLRRSQVLSTLRPAPGVFQQRVSLTACTGETSVLAWQLMWHADEGPAAEGGAPDAGAPDLDTSSSSSNGSSQGTSSGGSSGGGLPSGSEQRGRWVVESVTRDASHDQPLPTTPHPMAAPEAIVRAQLAALQQGDVLGASCFSMRTGRAVNSRRTSLVSHHDALRTLLQREPYRFLVQHAAVQLGAAALPSRREMLQEVAVLGSDGSSARFLWRLNLSSHSCWMVSGVLAAEEAAAAVPWPLL